MSNRMDWALPFCLGAWLLGFHAGASDDSVQTSKFDLLYKAPVNLLAPPSPKFDPNQEHQQFLTSGVLIDVRTSIIDGPGVRRRIVQGSARNTGAAVFPAAVIELLEAPIASRLPSGVPVPGSFGVVTSRALGDLAPGRTIGLTLSLERPDVLFRVYQIRLRSAP